MGRKHDFFVDAADKMIPFRMIAGLYDDNGNFILFYRFFNLHHAGVILALDQMIGRNDQKLFVLLRTQCNQRNGKRRF